MRVAFDSTALLDTPTGVGVFVREVLEGLARRDDLAVTAFAISWRGRSRLEGTVPAGIPVRSRPIPARLARPAWARGNNPDAEWLAGPCDVVHGPNHVVPPGGRAAELVTVHDLTALRYPEMVTDDVRRWPSLLERSLDRGAWIHTVSHAIAAEVREQWPHAAERVVAIPNGFRRPPAEAEGSDSTRGRRLAGGQRYVLALSTVEPRKDLPTLVAAFDRIASTEPDLRLVIAGPDGWGVEALLEALDRSPHRRRIRRLNWVGVEDRWALLRGASVVAYPSVYEGFGLVPLEALAAGTPVVATRIPTTLEVVGEDAALLVPVGDPDALAEALATTLGDESAASARVAAGQSRVDAYDWDRTANAIADLYHRISNPS